MRLVAVNGSPKGRESNTQVMVSALLKGAREAGAETDTIFLAEKEVDHCKGCLCCWLKTPGQCVIQDDMNELLARCKEADILVLATPLYFDNVTSRLKSFMDRMIVKGDPHFQKDENGECRHLKMNAYSPKLVLVSNCGFSERSHFQVISHWIRRVALNMKTEVAGELFAAQGSLLKTQVPENVSIVKQYLQHLETAGRELALGQKVSEETQRLLERNFIPDEMYIQNANSFFDSALASR
ncbi:MAG: NADPH-dependent reductase [Firmicutes bacterium]|nr:NADPH-dependent reductase [Bacillota bacterium]